MRPGDMARVRAAEAATEALVGTTWAVAGMPAPGRPTPPPVGRTGHTGARSPKRGAPDVAASGRIVERLAPGSPLERELADFLAAHCALIDGMRLTPPGDYRSIYHWLVEHGRWMQLHPRPAQADARRMMARLRRRIQPEEQQCYRNAQMAAIEGEPNVVYCDGMALPSGLIPVWHAWVLVDGLVWDPTWELLGDRRPDDVAYLGTDLATTIVCEAIVAHQEHSSIVDDWQRRWPLLRGNKSCK